MAGGMERRRAAGRETYMEEQARRELRERPRDVHAQLAVRVRAGHQGAEVKGKFAVMPYPAFEGGGKAGVLGGGNFVISTYAANPGGALKFIDFAHRPGDGEQSAADFGVRRC